MTPEREQPVKSGSAREKPLAGKVAIVTGASQGIGRSIALELASHGADVVITARNQSKLNDVAAEIRQTGSRAEIIAGDLRQPDFAATVVVAALQAFGNIDIVVNSAGATKRGNFLELSDADWHDGFELKLFGAARLCRSAWPHLARRKGSIVNIAGAGGRTADVVFAVGGSVNAAMGYFTKALAELGLNDGVQVNCINPGIIRTERTERRITAISKELRIDEAAAAQRLKDEFKITHFGEPEDIAVLVAYMVSPRGRLLHGAVVDIDAGMTKGL
jgi:3-oxoacyl-[acyl-carrier protein] reductase